MMTAYCFFAFDSSVADQGTVKATVISVMDLLAPERMRLLRIQKFAARPQPTNTWVTTWNLSLHPWQPLPRGI
jgi:hypothetical protein